MMRYINERNLTPQSVIKQWNDTVKTSSQHADIIIPNTKINQFTGMEHLCNYINLIINH